MGVRNRKGGWPPEIFDSLAGGHHRLAVVARPRILRRRTADGVDVITFTAKRAPRLRAVSPALSEISWRR